MRVLTDLLFLEHYYSSDSLTQGSPQRCDGFCSYCFHQCLSSWAIPLSTSQRRFTPSSGNFQLGTTQPPNDPVSVPHPCSFSPIKKERVFTPPDKAAVGKTKQLEKKEKQPGLFPRYQAKRL